MDRNALIIRNRTMAEAYHATPPKHLIRRGLLRALAYLPIQQQDETAKSRILMIRPDHLGDLLLTTPAISALRRAKPRAEMHALVGPWSAQALATNTDLDQILTLAFPGFNRAGNENVYSPYRLALKTARQLRRVGYSHAVIMRPDHWWGAMVAFLAGIPNRIGYAVGDVTPFLTQRLDHHQEHAVIQNMRLIEGWTGKILAKDITLRFKVHDADREDTLALLKKQFGEVPQRYFCIHPGSGTWVKRWGADQWATVADRLAAQFNATPVFTGGDHEESLVQAISASMKSRYGSLIGQTDVGSLAALYDNALVVLGPDSGPLHLAAAVDTPTVALFGPADPVEFAPWGDPHRHAVLTTDIACRPCRVLDWGGDDPANHPCIQEITTGRVVESAARVVTG